MTFTRTHDSPRDAAAGVVESVPAHARADEYLYGVDGDVWVVKIASHTPGIDSGDSLFSDFRIASAATRKLPQDLQAPMLNPKNTNLIKKQSVE